jgi:bacteriocin-like protein
VIAFASDAGFEVDLDDLVWLQDALAEVTDENGILQPEELSDDELDAVNGGVLGAISYIGNQVRQGAVTDNPKNALNPFNKAFWW